jgi:hypothetical protein
VAFAPSHAERDLDAFILISVVQIETIAVSLPNVNFYYFIGQICVNPAAAVAEVVALLEIRPYPGRHPSAVVSKTKWSAFAKKSRHR